MSAAVDTPAYEVETPLPLQSRGGRVQVAGWLLLGPDAPRPQVRLRVGATVVPRTAWLPRDDVARDYPGHPGAAHAGFLLEGEVPSGVHRATLEVSADGATWTLVKPLNLAVFPSVLRAVIERPRAAKITGAVRPEGWCFHPDHDLAAVYLKYGHREFACELGLPRDDVAALFPGEPRAARAGFLAPGNLPPGAGPLLIKAVTTDGQAFFLRTGREVDIAATGEASEADAAALPTALLPRHPRRPPAAMRGDGGAPLRVLFVLYGDFTANSALHVAGLANHLRAAGHEIVVAVPRDPQTSARLHAPAFRPVAFGDVPPDTRIFSDGAPADVVHAWTPRENVRAFVQSLRLADGAKVVVHLEDHEDVLTAAALGAAPEDLAEPDGAAAGTGRVDEARFADLPAAASHPRRWREFVAHAHAVTVVVERLRELVPAGPAVTTIRPAADERYWFPRPANPAMRAALRLPADAFLLAYHGNVHAANAAEVRELYGAVALLAQRGLPVFLLRTGRDFSGANLTAVDPILADHVIEIGHVTYGHHLPEILALADAFVQPGEPGLFNDYRLPSKLPEFFAIGRPVILPRTNLGLELRDGIDALVLDRADAPSIAAAVEKLWRDPALTARLAEGAQAFAAEHFSWARSAETLVGCYRATMTARTR